MRLSLHKMCLVLCLLSGQVLACGTWLPCDNQALNAQHIHDDLSMTSHRDDLNGRQGQEHWQVERHFNPLDRPPSLTTALSRGSHAELTGKKQQATWDVTRQTQDLSAHRVSDPLMVNHDHHALSKSTHEDIAWTKTDATPLSRGADAEPLARCD